MTFKWIFLLPFLFNLFSPQSRIDSVIRANYRTIQNTQENFDFWSNETFTILSNRKTTLIYPLCEKYTITDNGIEYSNCILTLVTDFNILKGEMSVIGPRPLLIKYLPLYNETQKHRHDVRPGLTGLAQINGRNAITWEKKFEYDVEYVNQLSFLMDLKIFFGTIKAVLKRDGINSETDATMEAFTGTPEKNGD